LIVCGYANGHSLINCLSGGKEIDAYDTVVEVQPGGEIHLENVPFSAGTEVEVIVSPKRASPEAFIETWKAMVAALRSASPEVSEEEILAETRDHRKGR
jgi:hypothetical protein